jgi:tetratricopeptide (TPR) repeat protein
MSLLRWTVPLLCVLIAGCRLGSQGRSDEQKDPYFLAGKNRLQERDYQGAIDMFEKALDVNPRSASAHFELGVLYEQQQSDYAAALYHYQRTVTLNSNLPSADLARQRTQECKRELAKTVIQPISMEGLQRELDSTRAENQQLKQQLQAWQNYYAGRGVTLSDIMRPATNPLPRSAQGSSLTQHDAPDEPVRSTPTNPQARLSPPPITTRIHTIASGETMATIARTYNIRVASLQNANPGTDARRMRPGQKLVIPPP